MKFRKSGADSGCSGREGRLLRDSFGFGKKVFFALVVLLDFDLVRPRFKEDLDFVRLTLFFIITSLDVAR